MTHDERRLLCLVARVASADDSSTVSLEIRRLLKSVQRQVNSESAERRRRANQDEDDADRRGEPR